MLTESLKTPYAKIVRLENLARYNIFRNMCGGVPKVLGHGLSEHAALFKLNITVSKTKYVPEANHYFLTL